MSRKKYDEIENAYFELLGLFDKYERATGTKVTNKEESALRKLRLNAHKVGDKSCT